MHRVGLHVVEDEVGIGVLHLYLVEMLRVERLAGLVGGVGDEFLRGMPGGIDTSGDGAVYLEVHLVDAAVHGDDSAAHALAHVELEPLGIAALREMAVDALAVLLGGVYHVAVDELLVVVLKAALLQREILVGHVGGRDETVADVGVDAVGGHIDREGLIGRPLAVLLDEGAHTDVALADETLPLSGRGAHVAAGEQETLVAGIEESDEVVALVFYGEMQGSHVAGHRDTDIVGIDGEGSGGLTVFSRQLCRAGREQNEGKQQIS